MIRKLSFEGVDIPVDIVRLKNLETLHVREPSTLPTQQLSKLKNLRCLKFSGDLSEWSTASTQDFRIGSVTRLFVRSKASTSFLEWVRQALPNLERIRACRVKPDVMDQWLHLLKTSAISDTLQSLKIYSQWDFNDSWLREFFLEVLPRFQQLTDLYLPFGCNNLRSLNAELYSFCGPNATRNERENFQFSTSLKNIVEVLPILLGSVPRDEDVKEVVKFLQNIDTVTSYSSERDDFLHPKIKAQLSLNRAGRHWIKSWKLPKCETDGPTALALLPHILARSSGARSQGEAMAKSRVEFLRQQVAGDFSGLFYAVRELLPPLSPVWDTRKESQQTKKRPISDNASVGGCVRRSKRL